MRIGVDARLTYHQPYGISRYTFHLLKAISELAVEKFTEANLPDEKLTAETLSEDDRFVVFQHRKHPKPLISGRQFRRATFYAPVHTKLEQVLLPLELMRFPIDLLHSPDFIQPLHTHLPTVITVHDLAFLHWPHFLTKDSAAYYGQIDRAAQRAKHIIVPSESTKQDLVGQLGVPSKKVSVIYEAANPLVGPLPVVETRAKITARYRLPERYILFVGTIEPRKNIDGLLRAFRHLQDKYNVEDTALVVVGGHGWLYEETLRLVDELQLREQTFFPGRVSEEDLWKLYVGARCHVHVAHYEGFGLPPLEAMACGTPSIVSNVSSLPEVVGDAALLVDPANWEEIAVAIHRLLTDDDLHAELSAKGLQRAACFSWRDAALRTLDVYQHVLGELSTLPATAVVTPEKHPHISP